MSQTQYTNAYPLMFNIPTHPFTDANHLLFHALTQCEENNGYKLAKAMRPVPRQVVPLTTTSRAPFAALENTVPGSTDGSSRGLKRTKAMRIAPSQKLVRTSDSRAPLVSSANIVLGSTDGSSEGLKRVKTITKSAGKLISQRRRKEKENIAIAFFANGF